MVPFERLFFPALLVLGQEVIERLALPLFGQALQFRHLMLFAPDAFLEALQALEDALAVGDVRVEPLQTLLLLCDDIALLLELLAPDD